MNSERYVQVLERFIYPLSFRLGDPSTDWWLMDDNATCHRSAVTNSYKSQASIRTLSWPARSPDLNPIENMWSLLKRRVRRLLLPGDDPLQLENLLKEEWNEISQATVNRLIGSMPTRVHDVIELSGESTRFLALQRTLKPVLLRATVLAGPPNETKKIILIYTTLQQ